MSFCPVEKLQIIKKALKDVPAWNQLTEDEKADCGLAILKGLEEIERTAAEYGRMVAR